MLAGFFLVLIVVFLVLIVVFLTVVVGCPYSFKRSENNIVIGCFGFFKYTNNCKRIAALSIGSPACAKRKLVSVHLSRYQIGF